MINGDSDGFGEVSGQTSILKLNKSKTSSVSDFTSILTGGLGNNRTEAFSRSGEDAGSFSNSILVSLDLLSRLIKVSLSSFLPMLAQVDVDDHVVVLDHYTIRVNIRYPLLYKHSLMSQRSTFTSG